MIQYLHGAREEGSVIPIYLGGKGVPLTSARSEQSLAQFKESPRAPPLSSTPREPDKSLSQSEHSRL